MKPIEWAMGLSLAVNAALAAWFLWPDPPVVGTASAMSEKNRAPAGELEADLEQDRALAKSTAAGQAYRPNGELWARVYDADPQTFIRNLREAGVSEKAVRSLVSAMSAHEWTALEKKHFGNAPDEYWRFNRWEPATPEARKALIEDRRALQKKYQLMELFAGELAESPEQIERLEREWGKLPMEKLLRLTRLQQDYSERQQDQIEAARQNGEQPDFQKINELIEAQKETEIATLLTPEEFEEFNLRSGPFANRVRTSLSLFEPTEAEYRALFALEKMYSKGGDRPTLSAQLRSAKAKELPDVAEYLAKAETALGRERYQQYLEAMELQNDQTARLVTRLGLPLATTKEVNRIRDDTMRRAREVNQNKSLSPEQRTAQVKAILAETRTALATQLGGQRGFEAYDETRGDWMRALQSAP